MGTFTLRTALGQPPAVVWARVSTFAGVNDELLPWLHMTVPRAARGRSLAQARGGERLGRSFVLLLGVLPVEWDDVTLESVTDHGFVEASTMATQRAWRHERRISAAEGGCVIEDRLTWEPRVPALGAVLRLVVPALFRHRHRRLVRRFGAAAP